MKVLIACEESQAVCKEFRALGHEAYSCDIQDCSGGHPEWHIKDDVLKVMKGYVKVMHLSDCLFEEWDEDFEIAICPECGIDYSECYHPGPTQDEYEYEYINDVLYAKVFNWDMMIAFPPCTDLAVSGASHFKKKKENGTQKKSVDFFMQFVNSGIKKWAIENPVGIMSNIYRKPDQIIQPYNFGHPESKKTCLWLRGLPKLNATNILKLPDCGYWENQTPSGQNKLGPSKERAKLRSKTYEGIAKAMAQQWGKI